MTIKRPGAGHIPKDLDSTVRALVLGVLVVVWVGATSGCSLVARHGVAANAPPGPSTPWSPPPSAIPSKPPRQTVVIPDSLRALLTSPSRWTLADIVDLALRNNPETRATWASARAAAAHLGSERGAYYPQITGAANDTKIKSALSSQIAYERTSYEPSLALHYILFDFGQRRGNVEEARQALYAANWTHNATIQNVVLEVERVYYQYLYTKAVRDADAAALKEADANLDAAQERQKSGLATTADVLQARSTQAQRKLALQTVEGQIKTIRGSLATAMGLSPTVDYDVGELPNNLPVVDVSKTVDELIDEAQVHRPDLASARAKALAARAHERSVRAEGWPTISVDGNTSRRFYDNPNDYSDTYQIGISLAVPLFTGFSHQYDVLEAQSKAQASEQQYQTLASAVELDVWTTYYNLKTAGERLQTARDFLKSATESHDVALGRYKSGVGTILELLSAQTALEDARAEDLQARTDWLLALAELAHATGRLTLAQPQPKKDGGR